MTPQLSTSRNSTSGPVGDATVAAVAVLGILAALLRVVDFGSRYHPERIDQTTLLFLLLPLAALVIRSAKSFTFNKDGITFERLEQKIDTAIEQAQATQLAVAGGVGGSQPGGGLPPSLATPPALASGDAISPVAAARASVRGAINLLATTPADDDATSESMRQRARVIAKDVSGRAHLEKARTPSFSAPAHYIAVRASLNTAARLVSERVARHAPDKLSAAKAHDIVRSVDITDPQKGRWGGKSVLNGRRLEATVKEIPGNDEWFRIILRVVALNAGHSPLTGTVRFHLHPSFRDPDPAVDVRGGKAELQRIAYGAFTVGAEADDGNTRLELDLSTLPDAPARFRAR